MLMNKSEFVCIINYSTLICIPILILFGLVHVFVIPKSLLLVIAYSILSTYITVQLFGINLWSRLCKSVRFVSVSVCSQLIWMTIFVYFITSLINVFHYRPIDLVYIVENHTNLTPLTIESNKDRKFVNDTPILGQSYSPTSFINPYPIESSQLIQLTCLVTLIPALCTSALLYSITVCQLKLSTLNFINTIPHLIVAPQCTRLIFGSLLLLIQIVIVLWIAQQNKLFSLLNQLKEDQSSQLVPPTTSSQSNVSHTGLIHSLIAQFAFYLLSLLLPRGMEYQSYLMRQWKLEGQKAVHSLSSNGLALARLMIAVVPRFAIAALCNPNRPQSMQLYSQTSDSVGLILIKFSLSNSSDELNTATLPQTTTAASTSSLISDVNKLSTNKEDPTEFADQLRLLSRIISVVDSLALGRVPTTFDDDGGANGDNNNNNANNNNNNNNTGDGDDVGIASMWKHAGRKLPNLVKVFNGGQVVGYGVGIPCDDKQLNTRTLQLFNLLEFAESIIDICEQTNKRMKSSSKRTSIHARIVLHTGPCVSALVTTRHPVFTVWGNLLDQSYELLCKSELTQLGAQHFLLAVDQVILSLYQMSLLSSSSSSCNNALKFQWRTINPLNKQIIMSANLPRAHNKFGEPMCIEQLFHFCAINSHCSDWKQECVRSESDTKINIGSNTIWTQSDNHSHIGATATSTVGISTLYTINTTNTNSTANSNSLNNVCHSTSTNSTEITNYSNKFITDYRKSTAAANEAISNLTLCLPNSVHTVTADPLMPHRRPVNQIALSQIRAVLPITTALTCATTPLCVNNLTTISSQRTNQHDYQHQQHQLAHLESDGVIVSQNKQLVVNNGVNSNTTANHKANTCLTAVSVLPSPIHMVGELASPTLLCTPPAPPPHQRLYPSTLNGMTQEIKAPINDSNNNDNNNINLINDGAQLRLAAVGHTNVNKAHTPGDPVVGAGRKYNDPDQVELNLKSRTQLQYLSQMPVDDFTLQSKLCRSRPNSYWPVITKEMPIISNQQSNATCNENAVSSNWTKCTITRPISSAELIKPSNTLFNCAKVPDNNHTPSMMRRVKEPSQTKMPIRPASLSSIDSFLAAEQACASVVNRTVNDAHFINVYKSSLQNIINNHQLNNHCEKQSLLPAPLPSRASNTVDMLFTSVVNTTTDNVLISSDKRNDNIGIGRSMNSASYAYNHTNLNSQLLPEIVDNETSSHHNPLYTDNEYESMTESQGNLLDAIDQENLHLRHQSKPERIQAHQLDRSVSIKMHSIIPVEHQLNALQMGDNSHTNSLSLLLSSSSNKDTVAEFSSIGSGVNRATNGTVVTSVNSNESFTPKSGSLRNKGQSTIGVHQLMEQQNVLDFPYYRRPPSPNTAMASHNAGESYLAHRSQQPTITSLQLGTKSSNHNGSGSIDMVHQNSSPNDTTTNTTTTTIINGMRIPRTIPCHQLHSPVIDNICNQVVPSNMGQPKQSYNHSNSIGKLAEGKQLHSICVDYPHCYHSATATSSCQCQAKTQTPLQQQVGQDLQPHSLVAVDAWRKPPNSHSHMQDPPCSYDVPYIHRDRLRSNELPTEPDCSDMEYVGMASLGPLSMTVLPSMTEDGITSCDGDEFTDDDYNAVPSHDNDDDWDSAIHQSCFNQHKQSTVVYSNLNHQSRLNGNLLSWHNNVMQLKGSSVMRPGNIVPLPPPPSHNNDNNNTIATTITTTTTTTTTATMENDEANAKSEWSRNFSPPSVGARCVNSFSHAYQNDDALSLSPTSGAYPNHMTDSLLANPDLDASHLELTMEDLNSYYQYTNVNGDNVNSKDIVYHHQLQQQQQQQQQEQQPQQSCAYSSTDLLSSRQLISASASIVLNENKSVNTTNNHRLLFEFAALTPSARSVNTDCRANDNTVITTTVVGTTCPTVVSINEDDRPCAGLTHQSPTSPTSLVARNGRLNCIIGADGQLIDVSEQNYYNFTDQPKFIYNNTSSDNFLQSDHEDLFAYHGLPNVEFGYVTPNRNGLSFNHSHSSSSAVVPTTKAITTLATQSYRPSLPQIAPVGLPDFSNPICLFPTCISNSAITTMTNDINVTSNSNISKNTAVVSKNHRCYNPIKRHQTNKDSNSEYDNLYPCPMVSNKSSSHVSYIDKTSCFPLHTTSMNKALKKLSSIQKPFIPPPGEESDAMSGYIGDAASSVYDTGDDDDDDDDNNNNNNNNNNNIDVDDTELNNTTIEMEIVKDTRDDITKLEVKSEKQIAISHLLESNQTKCIADSVNSTNQVCTVRTATTSDKVNIHYDGGNAIHHSSNAIIDNHHNDDSDLLPNTNRVCEIVTSNTGDQNERSSEYHKIKSQKLKLCRTYSQTSGNRSEYDNVDRSGSSRTGSNSHLQSLDRLSTHNLFVKYKNQECSTDYVKDKSSQSVSTATKLLQHPVSSCRTNSLHRSSSRDFLHKSHFENNSIYNCLFDAQIAAEARRISRQFRVMGWLPANACAESAVNQCTNSERAADMITPKIMDTHLDPRPPHLFLLPSMNNSRQASLRDIGLSDQISETVTTVTSQIDDDDEGELGVFDVNDEFELEHAVTRYLNKQYSTKHDVAKWRVESFGDTQLGCILVRPRSLSATCLNANIDCDLQLTGNVDESEQVSNFITTHNSTNIDDLIQLQNAPSARLCNRQKFGSSSKNRNSTKPNTNTSTTVTSIQPQQSPGFQRLQRRTAGVRNLLPAALHQYILPGCMSSLSRSSSIKSSSHFNSPSNTNNRSCGILFLSLSRKNSTRHYCYHNNRKFKEKDERIDKFTALSGRRWTSDPDLQLAHLCETLNL